MPNRARQGLPLHAAAAWFSAGSGRRQMLCLMVGAFLFLVACQPLNLLHGFLFAEEGTTYLRYAWLAPPVLALFAPHQQYYSLVPNVLALLEARVLPLAWAGVCSAWLVLLTHLYLVYAVVQCERFVSGRAKALAAAAVLLAPGAASVSVGSTQIQFVFALLCMVVLVSDAQRHVVARTLSVLLASLNGVVSCMLAPFFLYRAWRLRRSGPAWTQALLLCGGVVVQAAVLRHALPLAVRKQTADHAKVLFVDMLANHLLVLPFLTRFAYHAASLLGHAPVAALLGFAALGLAGMLALDLVLWPAGAVARTLLLVGLFHASCCALGVEGKAAEILGGGERYFFAANAAVALALVLRWQQGQLSKAYSSRVVTVLLALLLLSGLGDTLRFWRANQSGPVWARQVHAWKLDPTHIGLRVNPAVWADHTMMLPPQPAHESIPFYVFDSNTRPEVLREVPPLPYTGLANDTVEH